MSIASKLFHIASSYTGQWNSEYTDDWSIIRWTGFLKSDFCMFWLLPKLTPIKLSNKWIIHSIVPFGKMVIFSDKTDAPKTNWILNTHMSLTCVAYVLPKNKWSHLFLMYFLTKLAMDTILFFMWKTHVSLCGMIENYWLAIRVIGSR